MIETENKIKVKKQGGKIFGLFAIFVSLIALGSSAYLYYLGMQTKSAFKREIGILKSSTATDLELLGSNNAQLASHIKALESQIHGMNDKINPNLSLLQINELISMANQSLIVYGDVKSSLKLLKYASDVLTNNNDAQYVGVKSALANDIAKLGQLQYADSIVLLSKINLLAKQITVLPLINDKNVVSVESKTVDNMNVALNQNSIWNKFWYNLKKDFKSLVLISSTRNSQAIELLPQKEIILRQNIKLYLLNARMALLQHDEESWKFNLNNINASLENYFAHTALLESIINNINELLKVDISTGDANIDSTLTALNKLNNLQK